jgi:hypothetical protein
MTILSALRDRLSPRDASELRSAGDAQQEPVVDSPLPFAGYDRLCDKEVIEGLSGHSQIELEAVESYERSHEDRVTVLDKLRYLRGSEPLPGYDALSVKEIVTALEDADLATIKKVRDYERKFTRRRDVAEAAVRAQHERQAAQPASAAPSYQPVSATR